MKFLAILFTIVLLSFSACRSSERKPADSHSSIHVTDFRNRELVLSKPATRIVCLIESSLSGLYMLHAEKQVAGTSSSVYKDDVFRYYSVLDDRIRNRNLPAPGNWDFVSIENVVALKPDLVIIWASQKEAIQALENHGIAVYGVMLNSLEDIYREISDLGLLTGRTGRADSLISYTKTTARNLGKMFTGLQSQRRSVYFMWPQGVLETAGTTSTVNELLDLAGARNCCNIPQEHVVINKESLITYDPGVWIMWNNSSMDPNDIMDLPEFRNTTAVKTGRVYELPPVFMCDLWTLKFPLAARLVSGWCYPGIQDKTGSDSWQAEVLTILYGQKGAELIKL